MFRRGHCVIFSRVGFVSQPCSIDQFGSRQWALSTGQWSLAPTKQPYRTTNHAIRITEVLGVSHDT